MKNYKLNILCLLCGLYANYGVAQQSPFAKGQLYLGVDLGLSFYNEELAHLNGQLPPNYQMNDAIRFTLAPKIDYAIANRLMLSAQIGFDFQNYKYQQTGQRFATNNYRFGVGVKYYVLKITEGFYFSTAVDVAYNYFHIQQGYQPYENTDQALWSVALNFGIDIMVSENILFSVLFTDLVDYHTAFPNFDYRKGWQLNPVFKNFLHYPHFSVMYRLN